MDRDAVTPATMWRWLLVIVACLNMACAPAGDGSLDGCPDSDPYRALFEAHLARYPAMDISDALKLLQQATLGSEHAVTDAVGATVWMAREWDTMGEGPVEPMVDTLGSGGYARVHLRPYRNSGGDPEQLTAGFIAASRTAPDTAQLECAVAAVSSVVPWDPASWNTEVERWRADGYPAMHHSEAYAGAYRPAYRVVRVDQAGGLLGSDR